MNLDSLLAGVVGASIVAILNFLQDRSRRHHERVMASDERTALMGQARTEKREDAYRAALIRLRAAQAAFHRARDALFADEKGLPYPFSSKGSIDWAIDEADQLRGVQADMDVFGSTKAASEFAQVLKYSEIIRWGLGMPDYEWGAAGAEETVTRFDAHLDAILDQVRRDLEP